MSTHTRNVNFCQLNHTLTDIQLSSNFYWFIGFADVDLRVFCHCSSYISLHLLEAYHEVGSKMLLFQFQVENILAYGGIGSSKN